jgi:5,10-methenyltetrahydrofolate synthetase
MTETVSGEPYRNLPGLTKGELRSRLRELRAEAVSPEVSLAAQRHILEDPAWAAAGIVALYVPFGGEVDTTLLQHMARLGGKQLWLPRCLPDAGRGVMEFAQCQTPHLRPGAFGIMEPDPLLCPAAPDGLAPDLVLVPAIAFDRAGYRLGYGGGYYDRFLDAALARDAWARTRLLGLAPEKLVVPALPRDAWDHPVHGIATERGVTWL